MDDTFLLGCNYWASHAGIRMWEDWSEAAVEKDFAALSEIGCNCIRVFPLWSVFQPIVQLYTYMGVERQILLSGDRPLPADGSGIDDAMTARLVRLLELAAKHRFKVIVSLINGWMSGRLFAPPALEGKNLLTDPAAVYWQTKFVGGMVARLKNCSAVYAWEPGNECNCMADVSDRYEAYNWAAAVVGAVRAADASRPVYSGMHGLSVDSRLFGRSEAPWLIRDQAELTDSLTVHPYPAFMPYCACDPVGTMKPLLYGIAEGALYRDVGGKACLVEEAGTLGPMNAADELSGLVASASVFSACVHGLGGYLWWCAFDCGFPYPPYDWYEAERELGAFCADRSPKPVAQALARFGKKAEKLRALPPMRTDAVCLLANPMREPARDDAWRSALGAFVLAKQAGFDLRFADANGEIPEADMYMLPSLKDLSVRHAALTRLRSRVEAGATLYLSLDDAVIAEFSRLFGLTVVSRAKDAAEHTIEYGRARIPVTAAVKYEVVPDGCEVLAAENGMPVYVKKAYGKGTLYLLLYPIEKEAAKKSGVNTPDGYAALSALYEPLLSAAGRSCRKDNPFVGVTEHIGRDGTYFAFVNYSSVCQTARLRFAAPVRLVPDLSDSAVTLAEEGGGFVLTLPPCGTALARAERPHGGGREARR